jgi:hypothetical protein
MAMPWHCQLACSLARWRRQRRRRHRQQCLGIASLLACLLACSHDGGGDGADNNALTLPAHLLAFMTVAVAAAQMTMPWHC